LENFPALLHPSTGFPVLVYHPATERMGNAACTCNDPRMDHGPIRPSSSSSAGSEDARNPAYASLGAPLPLPGESESQRYLPGLPVTRHLEGLCVWTHTHKHTHCQERECAQVGSVTTREGFTMVYNKTKHTHRVLHKYNPRHTRLSRRAGVWHGAYPPLNLMDTVTTYMNYKTALSF
jgi:hypothetical protein